MRINPLHELPAYGDTLEVMWGADWYAHSLRTGASPFFYPDVFHPQGWYTGTLAHTPLFLLAMGLLGLVLPAAIPFNLAALASSVVCYMGMRRLLRLYIEPHWIVVIVGLLYTFWGARWLRLGGHLNLAWLSALLPWLAWLLLTDRARRWKIGVGGLIWALNIVSSLDGVWLGAAVLAAYLLARPRSEALKEVAGMTAVALLLSAPTLAAFQIGRSAGGGTFYDFAHISHWGASLNSLLVPAVFHPWLQGWVHALYPGPYNESGVFNFGILVAPLAAVALVRSKWTETRMRFALILAVGGLLLALGPVLRWSGEYVRWAPLAGLDQGLWRLGHAAKPELLVEFQPPQFATAVPLPGWAFYAFVPLSEGARVAARFGFVAALSLFPLIAVGLAAMRYRWLQWTVALLLIIEGMPWPVASHAAYPPAEHPAFTWLRSQASDGPAAVLDLFENESKLSLLISGETLYATTLHGKPAIAGVGSMWADATWFWLEWLRRQGQPLNSPDLAGLTAAFDVRYILVHAYSNRGLEHVQQLANPDLRLVDCFDPPAAATAWAYPICVLEVIEPPAAFDAVPRQGWSGAEAWGRWAEGRLSTARWAAPVDQNYVVRVSAFPHCVEGRQQWMTVHSGVHKLGELTFDGCSPASGEFVIHADRVTVGWNDLSFRYAYAVSPSAASQGAIPDTRLLSAGFTGLEIIPMPDSTGPGPSQ